MSLDDATPRQLPERTGRHLCIQCLGEVGADDYLRNDHVCNDCAAKDEREHPLKSTPDAQKKNE